MGVLNVTPDSFWDGGRWADPEAAVARGLAMIAEGADIVDVGGESSRPGATPVALAEESRRVLPVIAALAPHVRVSVDTVKASVAEAAIEAGATLVNDISASLAPVAAAAGVGWVAMHMRATPADMQSAARYEDVVGEVCEWLAGRALWGSELGLDEVWVDPGIGFAKTAAHNLGLLRHLDRVVDLGYPVLVGTSRKSFLGSFSAGAGPGSPTGPGERLEASLATAVWSVERGVQMVRVHDVSATVHALTLQGTRSSARTPS
jgi:dihydropteroate synthase